MWEETVKEAAISSERRMVVEAETREQQALLDLIAEELGDAGWFDAEGFEIYAWGETSEGRPVLFVDEVFAFGTLSDGRVAGTMQHGASVRMVSFRDGKIVTHAPAMPGDRWAPTNSAGSS